MAMIENPRFPDNISYGSTGGPTFNTTIRVVESGFEYSNINWDTARHKYNAALGVRNQTELNDLVKFFHMCRGRGHYFRYKDWQDYKTSDPEVEPTPTDETIGVGDSVEVEFQLIKTYDLSSGQPNVRDIKKIVNGSALISVNDVTLNEGPDYTINYNTGIVTLALAPSNIELVKWGGEFDVPCRFDTDQLSISMDFYIHGSASVPIIEVRV